jgi:peptide chain release factor 3
MVIDAAKGIEPQTRKLFEVCRMRSVPIITFVNKVDREGRSVFETLDEVADALALDVVPMAWPIGMGGLFQGVLNLATNQISRPEGDSREFLGKVEPAADIPDDIAEEIELAQAGYPEFDLEAYRHGDLTPVFFGSALKNFGVAELIDAIAKYAPPPRPQSSEQGTITPERPDVTGFVFKVQANMDPQHRDRIAFMRMVSGTFKRGMKLTPSGLGKPIAVHSPILFFAQDREIADTAGRRHHRHSQPRHAARGRYPVRTQRRALHRPAQLRARDPAARGAEGPDQDQAAAQGAGRPFRRRRDPGVLPGDRRAVDRRRGRPASARRADFAAGGGIQGGSGAGTIAVRHRALAEGSPEALKAFADFNLSNLAKDRDGDPVFLARSAWDVGYQQERNPELAFSATKER